MQTEEIIGTQGTVDALGALLSEVRDALLALQKEDGHWLFELEADTTIPSEYILLRHFLGEVEGESYAVLEGRIARYLRAKQQDGGGWPLFAHGNSDLSATVKAYFALKLAGDDPEAEHMRRARQLILSKGGAARSNVFTRFALALFGQVPWRATPAMPIEIMHLPQWSPFSLARVSYWSRTVIVPLLVLAALRPRARNPRGVRIDELFLVPPNEASYPMNPTGTLLGAAFAGLDRVLRRVEPRLPRRTRQQAMEKAMNFISERLNGDDGLGGIFPAMANAVMAFDALGLSREDARVQTARASLEKLLAHRGEESYCQPCLSPVWDTCLAVHALLETGLEPAEASLDRACDWLLEREITETAGDWKWKRPNIAPGGWAFQYQNAYYPDVDDTAVVAMAMHRIGNPKYSEAIERAAKWILGMQSKNGGWGAFDADNTAEYLNAIPFADHGALLDPPTVDVTARCLGFLAQIGYPREHEAVAKGLEFLRREQEPDGSWYGRWGVNYVYGTWSALSALNACGEDPRSEPVRQAVQWLEDRQQADGGWGEDCATYWEHRRGEAKGSTPSQTAWALLGLMAAGRVQSEAVERGVRYLRAANRTGARWDETLWTGTGFPRVFYLKYHGYSAYFPLWALGRYRALQRHGSTKVVWGL